MQTFKLKADIGVRDDGKRSTLVDFIDEFWIDHV